MSDKYGDIKLDYVDAKVAAVFCLTGVCNYVIADKAITLEWITTHVSPNIREVTLAILFGKAVLWCAFFESQDLLPAGMLEQITMGYNQIRIFSVHLNHQFFACVT